MKINLLTLVCLVLVSSIVDAHNQPTFTVHNPPCPDNLAVQWARTYLDLFRTTFGFLSPPMNARALFIFTASMHDALVPYTTDLKPYLCKVQRRPINEHTPQNIATSISFAVYRSIQQIFAQFPNELVPVTNFFISLGLNPLDVTEGTTTPQGIGNFCSRQIHFERVNDGSNQWGNEPGTKFGNGVYSDYTNYSPVNPAQEVSGFTDCSKVKDRNHWTPLKVPNRCGGDSIQEALSPHMSHVKPFAIDLSLLQSVKPPPQLGTNTEVQFKAEVQEILNIYQMLGDVQKVIAEFWADGIGRSLPAGHWHFITIFSIKKYCLDVKQSVRVLFLQASASFDAGIITWLVKRYYDFVRPVTAIQCSCVQNSTITTWRGPYQGVGQLLGSQWKPYQNIYFVTPPFQEYVSGHSAFSTASAQVLKEFFGCDSYGETIVIPQGKSCEPKIEAGEPGFIDGLTNVPNSGPNTIGYSPAGDIALFWETFTDAANESGLSRRYGGVHFESGDLNGRLLGRKVGSIVFKKFKKLKK
jgi:hypothetical protein